MRTIKELHRDRLVAEAEEADIRGLTKTAEHLTRQIEKSATRPNEKSYTYDSVDFVDDIHELLWTAVVRTADFHDAYIDAEQAQKVVDIYAEKFVSDIRKVARINTPIGAAESTVAGEIRRSAVIEIEED